MRYHLFLPQMRMTHDQIVGALAAEAAGFESRVHGPPRPALAVRAPMWEAMQVAGWVLARTSTLRVGHLVLCDSPAPSGGAGRQVTSLDPRPGGRFELGLGWGRSPRSSSPSGSVRRSRRRRWGAWPRRWRSLEALWSREAVTFRGEHFTLTDARQQPPPPVRSR